MPQPSATHWSLCPLALWRKYCFPPNMLNISALFAEGKMNIIKGGMVHFVLLFSGFPGSSIGCASPTGKLYISNYRLIFVPNPQFPNFSSFSCPFNAFYNLLLTSNELFPWFSRRKTVIKAMIRPVSWRRS